MEHSSARRPASCIKPMLGGQVWCLRTQRCGKDSLQGRCAQCASIAGSSKVCCEAQVKARSFPVCLTGSTQLYFRLSLARVDLSCRRVQHLPTDFQLCIIVLTFPATLPAGIAGHKPVLLWVPVKVLQEHGYVMSDGLASQYSTATLAQLPSYTVPTVLVRLELPGPIAAGGPVAHPFCPPVNGNYRDTSPMPLLPHADIM